LPHRQLAARRRACKHHILHLSVEDKFQASSQENTIAESADHGMQFIFTTR